MDNTTSNRFPLSHRAVLLFDAKCSITRSARFEFRTIHGEWVRCSFHPNTDRVYIDSIFVVVAGELVRYDFGIGVHPAPALAALPVQVHIDLCIGMDWEWDSCNEESMMYRFSQPISHFLTVVGEEIDGEVRDFLEDLVAD